jgi:hypothetical protein
MRDGLFLFRIRNNHRRKINKPPIFFVYNLSKDASYKKEMIMKKYLSIFSLALLLALTGCGAQTSSVSQTTGAGGTVASAGSSSSVNPVTLTSSTDGSPAYKLNSAKWSYDTSSQVYYQVGLNYCTQPASSSIETMGIFVPGAYFTGTKNSDGTYTCAVNASGAVGGFTAATAPIVFPVNTPGYASQKAPTSYSSQGQQSPSSYLSAGFIYVQAGMRGKDTSGGEAPWGVTDLKAAIRAYRYNADSLPGSTNLMFTFGMSGGGAQSALAGTTGDSPLYTPYLNAIGAPLKDASGNALSDAVCGSMCWCPITSLDIADEAYEWNMGQFYTASTRASGTWTAALSADMAVAFASTINSMKLKNGSTVLSLEASSSGHYLSGSYYDYIVSVVENSLNNYLTDTYASDTSSKASYVSSLGSWAAYDSSTDKASIASLGGFIAAKKNASKSVGAFDNPARSAGENCVFRNTDATSGACHFDTIEGQLISANASKYSSFSGYTDYTSAFTSDFALTDAVGQTVTARENMYNPMYFLSDYYQGYQTSTVAKHWRIRTGLNQTDTALTTEANLALALKSCSSVSDVDFASVWGQGHTEAERTGDAASNFISWVEGCCK